MFLGVLELNCMFLVVGACVLFGVRGFQTVRDILLDSGLAYMLGVAFVGVLACFVLVIGRPLSTATIFAITALVAVTSLAIGIRRKCSRPRRLALEIRLPRTLEQLVTLVAAFGTFVVAVSLYRAFRNQPLVAYDAWNFWVPKAKSIYFFGGIDNAFFKSLPAPSYPLLVPALDSMVFRLAHSTNATALAQQQWFLFVGFIGAVASLLRPLARQSIVWIFIALFTVVPQVELRWFQLLADWTLDAFFVISALVLIRWLLTREGWLLAISPLPLAAVLITKREGQLFVACLALGMLVATTKEWRFVYPRTLTVVAGAFAVSQLPWRIWWTSRHLPSDLGGLGNTPSLHRVLPAARIVADLMFSYQMWLLPVPLAVVGVAALHLRIGSDRRLAALLATTAGSLFVGFVWVIWSDPTIPLDTRPATNPDVREVAAIAAIALFSTPVLLTAVVGREPSGFLNLEPLAAARSIRTRSAAWAMTRQPKAVLSGLIGLQWLVVLAIARTVRHTGWIFYQGGDQLWYYTTGWLLGHGQFPQPGVGYLWSVLLAPFALASGPNVANAYPAIVVLQFLVLLPVTLLCMYGIGVRIGGRLFGYWTALLWIAMPLIGIWYTEPGYHQRFTELLLPQGLGLTALGDYPTTVAALVSAYFCVRALTDATPATFDVIAAGLAAGAAIAIKPSTALFLVGPALAFLAARYWRPAAIFAAALAPAILTLAYVKWRGFGYLPLLQSSYGAVRVAAGTTAPFVLAGAGHYLPFHWKVFETQLDQVREHFWSVRLVEWLVIGGAIALVLRSRRLGALVAGWFGAIVIIKTGSGRGDLESGSLLRLVMPAFPAFVLLVASLPFLWPGLARSTPWSTGSSPRRLSSRWQLTAVLAVILLTAVVPALAYSVASPLTPGNARAGFLQTAPIPLDVNVHAQARPIPGGASIAWPTQHAQGGAVFYHVFRRPNSAPLLSCAGATAQRCQLQLTDLGATKDTHFVDRTPGAKDAVYYVGVAANWLDDPTLGDVYELSRPASP